jgi:hypothetical protein
MHGTLLSRLGLTLKILTIYFLSLFVFPWKAFEWKVTGQEHKYGTIRHTETSFHYHHAFHDVE